MKMKYKACMFDLDGTLCNTLDSIAHFGNSALKFCGFTPVATEEYKLMVGNGADMLIRRMLKKSVGDVSEETVAAVRKKYDELYEREPLNLVVPYEGIVNMLHSLKAAGLKICVLSNKPDDMTKAVIGGIFGDGVFDLVQGQLSGFPKKPDPTAPLYILNKLSVTPSECFYMGDSGVDMQTAVNTGMTPCGVSWGFRSVEELKENGAEMIVNCTEEVLSAVVGD